MSEHPPYSIMPDMLSPIEQIGAAIDRAKKAALSPDLRPQRIKRIRTIRGLSAI